MRCLSQRLVHNLFFTTYVFASELAACDDSGGICKRKLVVFSCEGTCGCIGAVCNCGSGCISFAFGDACMKLETVPGSPSIIVFGTWCDPTISVFCCLSG